MWHLYYKIYVIIIILYISYINASTSPIDEAKKLLNIRRLNYNKAKEILENIIEKNENTTHVKGAYNILGEMHLYGFNAESLPNYEKALYMFNQGANLGDSDCQYNRGFMYARGLGVKADMGKAILNWYFSATGGSALAQMTLGYFHLNGYYVPKSCSVASKYYSEVAENVMEELMDTHSSQRIVENIRLSKEEHRLKSPDEDEDVIQYYEHSANSGDVGAQVALGHLYFYGARGVEQNAQRAAQFFQAAANEGDPRAMATLGQMYAKGLGVEASNETALEYFKKAAEKGNTIAQNGLGYMYMHGRSVKKDHNKALMYFKKAADRNNADAQFNLGIMYLSGMGVEKSYQAALQYFTRASQHGHTRALFQLGQMHLNGLGSAPSCSIAVRFFKTVSERGKWSNILGQAHRFYVKGSVETSLLMYMKVSDAGFEVSQSNAAWILDPIQENILKTIQLDDRVKYSLHYYKLAASQGNIDARRVMGDYYYYGIADKINYEEAAQQYLMASDKNNAQAMFNMGFMHQYGVGVPQDFHLAKRYFDQALATKIEAIIPVRLALFNLWLHQKVELDWYDWWPNWLPPYVFSPFPNHSKLKIDQSPVKNQISNPSSTTKTTPNTSKKHKFKLANKFDWEDILLYILCFALAIVVFLRSQ